MMTLAELRQNICQRLENMEEEKLSAVIHFLDNLDIFSSFQYQYEKKDKFDDETRKELIKSLRGMASHSSFSSEKFAQQKQKEIDRE